MKLYIAEKPSLGRAIANARRFNWQDAAKDLWAIFEEARQVRNIDKERLSL